MTKVFGRPACLKDKPYRYCPGCSHGVLHRIVAETVDRLGIRGRTIGIAPVGCAVFAYDYFDIDMIEVPHGRPPAIATGMKRSRPDAVVFSYQGDGDLAAIGTAEIVHAAARGEAITDIFVNNGIYGMTGGQMAPTTLLGQRTTSTPTGRDPRLAGYPLPITEMLAILPGVAYAARGSIADPGQIGRTKAMIRRACEVQAEGRGFAIVEILSTCPVGWGMTPREAARHVAEVVPVTYPIGVMLDRGRAAAEAAR
jgi:2-oxoglutarate ferredoxin oxidoreductase subunit beta